jgi:plastocyanin domain-containing protein
MKSKRRATNNANQPRQRMLLAVGIGGIILCVALFIVLWRLSATSTPETQESSVATAVQAGEYQVINMAVTPYGYEPSTFAVQEGKPVRMIIDGTQVSGCTRYITSPQLGFNKRLEAGENIIEFTPPGKGTYGFSCSMGMVRGTITVVGEGESPAVIAAPKSAGGSCGAGGCGCGAAVA